MRDTLDALMVVIDSVILFFHNDTTYSVRILIGIVSLAGRETLAGSHILRIRKIVSG